MALEHAREALLDLQDQFGRLERTGSTLLAQHPARQLFQVCIRRRQDAVLDPAAPDHPLRPPRGLLVELDLRLADVVAPLPGLAAAKARGIDAFRGAEVTLAPRRETDVAVDAGDAK